MYSVKVQWSERMGLVARLRPMVVKLQSHQMKQASVRQPWHRQSKTY